MNTALENGTDKADVNGMAERAAAIFDAYKHIDVSKKIFFLEQIAKGLSDAADSCIEVTSRETSLPPKRLEGEMQRTINQVKMFASLLKDGSWVNAIVDTAQPGRLPLPKPDIRQMQIPLGVVAVFGASNFPYAFSVAGGDTIAALAAGCPVLYKVHSGHPITSRLVGAIIQQAAKAAGLPAAVFSLVEGSGHEVGLALVEHPLVKAVAFTGSYTGGMALYDAASQRLEPIPVYAEMGSINPVFILPDAMKENHAGIAKALAASNTLSMGQFCTKPGVIISLRSDNTTAFLSEFIATFSTVPSTALLTDRIADSYKSGIEVIKQKSAATLLANEAEHAGVKKAMPFAFKVSATNFLADKTFYEEIFGPYSIHVIAETREELYAVANSFTGQLTGTVWGTGNDFENHGALLQLLENKVGRLLLNNVPTGVEVTDAMVHGGPFPATIDGKFSAVGGRSIYRFTRPLCYQNFPDSLLPAALQNNNPLQLHRFVNGRYNNESIEVS